MGKVLLQLILLVGLFFGTWFLISRVDWMHVFRVKQATQKTEEKLGNLLWDLISKTEKEKKSATIVSPVDTLVTRICEKNNLDRDGIKLHIVEKDEVNAFALPNGHLVVYTGLILACDNEAELCGVLGHEMAHIEKKHVMKKLIKEIGLSALISITSGGKGGAAAGQILKLLSSRAYDRALESEADMTSVDYLIKADIDPEPFANFMYNLAEKEPDHPEQLVWISTHPDSKARAEKIIDYIKDKEITKKPVLAPKTWNLLQDRLKEEHP